jgi:hypothetical protein
MFFCKHVTDLWVPKIREVIIQLIAYKQLKEDVAEWSWL